jgi:guanine deaminase
MVAEQDFMKKAIELAVENVRNGGGPFAALIVKDGKIIATGVNRVTATNDPTAHAEIVAIRAACQALKSFQLDGCELYTTCEPCPMCMGAIYWARPLKVYFASSRFDAADAGFDDSMIYDELTLPYQDRKIPIQQLLRDESLVAFHEWEQKADKIPY